MAFFCFYFFGQLPYQQLLDRGAHGCGDAEDAGAGGPGSDAESGLIARGIARKHLEPPVILGLEARHPEARQHTGLLLRWVGLHRHIAARHVGLTDNQCGVWIIIVLYGDCIQEIISIPFIPNRSLENFLLNVSEKF